MFGRLTIVSIVRRRANYGDMVAYAQCLCECGGVVEPTVNGVVSGHTRSCGCLRPEVITSHSKSQTPGGSSYEVWHGMKQRCLNPRSKDYKNYGERGITVCESWLAFENFYADMGDKPQGMSLDRVDNSKGYSPANCRWATTREQDRNKRTNIYVSFFGERVLFTHAMRLLKAADHLYMRLKKEGKTHQEIVNAMIDRYSDPKTRIHSKSRYTPPPEKRLRTLWPSTSGLPSS